jgi:hypothetical protein
LVEGELVTDSIDWAFGHHHPKNLSFFKALGKKKIKKMHDEAGMAERDCYRITSIIEAEVLKNDKCKNPKPSEQTKT